MSLFRASALVAALSFVLPSCKTSTEQSFSTSSGAESSALQSEPSQVSKWLFQEDFKGLKLTRKNPAAPYTAYRWYSREDTNVNGELQKYRSYLFNDAQTTTGADAVVCKGASTDKDHCASELWTMKVVDDDSASDKKALQLRAIRDKATGIIYSGRIETKRFAEFKPSATKGIRFDIRLKFDENSITNGIWPAFWLLGSQNNEDPVIGDGDTIPWPCRGSSEIALMEIGGATGRQYLKSPLYVGFDPCKAYVPKETRFAEKSLAADQAFDDGKWQTLSLEWEQGRARFYHNGLQYGDTISVSDATFTTNMFLVLNLAVGGTLGGAVKNEAFDTGRSLYVDYIHVGEFDAVVEGRAHSFSGNPALAHLEAAQNDENVGIQFEASSEGGQNAGWIDANDSISWFVDVPAQGAYKFKTHSSVNRPEGPASYSIYVRKESEQEFRKVTDQTLANTNGWQNWRDFETGAINLDKGKYWVKIVFTSNNQNLKWLEIAKQDTITGNAGKFDYIIVGAGASGAITAQRLVEAGKNVLMIEAGGPTAKSLGGTDYPPYVKDQSRTIFDVPGEYGNIAWKPKGDNYKIKEAGFTYQGMGYGGNTQFNGMLFQMAPPYDFNSSWPDGWKGDVMRAYAQRILKKMAVTDKPSTDGRHYLSPVADAVHEAYAGNGYALKNTSVLGALGDRYYSYPYVVTKDGQRGGVVDAYLQSIIGHDGESKVPNFTVYHYSKVDRILFDANQKDKAIGVAFSRRTSLRDLDSSGQKTSETVMLNEGGHVVMAAGALITPRLLLLSGIGPQSRAKDIFRDGFSVPLTINNDFIGTSLFDHIGAMVTYEFSGNNSYQAYDVNNYTENAVDLQKFLQSGTGPYTQYGPVSIAHEVIGAGGNGQPNVEFFVNPSGAGNIGQVYNTKKDFSVYAMLMRPKAREALHIGSDGFVQYPVIYLTNDDDMTTMAQSIQRVMQMMRKNPNFKLKLGPGGVSHPQLNADNINDVKTYLSNWDPFRTPDGSSAPFSRLIMNHWGGTVPLGTAVDPKTLVVRGTLNVHVVDASLIPAPLSAHPVATIMAVAERASDLLLGK